MRRSTLVVGLLAVAFVACKAKGEKATGNALDAAAATSANASAAPPVVPPEPRPPLAEKAGEVPALEAKLAADKQYTAAWGTDHPSERAILLTALSDLIAYGTMHADAQAAAKKAKLADALTTIDKLLARTGRLPTDLSAKVEAHLAANRTAPRLGLWNPEEKGQPLLDATALAMWLHPNDSAIVRERMRALVKGPFPSRKDTPMKRKWLANLGDVIDRLGALGTFTKEDCTELGARWTQKTLVNGQTQFGCEAPKEAVADPAASQGGEDDQLRKACKAGTSAHLQKADEIDVKVMCHMAVEKLLKSPKSAEFPGAFDDDKKPSSPDGCTTVYPSYVDAQNAFGAKIRTNYICVYDPRTGVATPTLF